MHRRAQRPGQAQAQGQQREARLLRLDTLIDAHQRPGRQQPAQYQEQRAQQSPGGGRALGDHDKRHGI